mgnify:CR=1 FL=1
MAAFGKEWEQSNEELVAKAKAGSEKSMEQLYIQTRRLIFHTIKRYFGYLVRDRAIDTEDLEQAGALGFLYAVEKYDPAAGALFSTYLIMAVKHYARRLLGLGERVRAHQGAISLDEPIPGGDDEDTTRADLLADEKAQDPEESALAVVEREQTAREVWEALEKLPEEEAQAVRLVYLQSPPPGWRKDRALCAKHDRGIRKLRQNKKLLKYARACYDDIFVVVGVSAFKNSFTSAVELAAIRRERRAAEAGVRLERLEELAALDCLESDTKRY